MIDFNIICKTLRSQPDTIYDDYVEDFIVYLKKQDLNGKSMKDILKTFDEFIDRRELG